MMSTTVAATALHALPVVAPIDRDAAMAAVADLLAALGHDPDHGDLSETPRRVADAFLELLTPEPFEMTTFPNEDGYDEPVVVRGIPFVSLCRHHLLPFRGTATVGYLPGERLVGLSKLARVVDHHARGLQVQEALTAQIARTLDAIETAQIAKRHGMRAIVFKQHYLETASWAYLVSRIVPGIQLFGGIALNRSVGGLNPNAVEQVATFAGGFGRVVYFPTFESEHYNPGSPIAVPIDTTAVSHEVQPNRSPSTIT